MKTNNQQETEAMLRVFEKLEMLEKELQEARKRIKELEDQIYGDSK
jgi:DNA polymerase IIIc chi subunit